MAKVVMYKKIPCPYCERAENLFKSRGVSVDIVDLSNKPEEMAKIKAETGWQTVPIIMINGKLIGGYTDLKALDEDGKLDPLLAST